MAHVLLRYLFFAVALGTPEIALPFNSQVPPVARVGEPYAFTFSSTTFKPNGDTFQYTLNGAPAWLTLDAGSRTLSGTPGAGDIGTTTPTIVATDSTGSTSMDCTLVIVATPGPQIGKSISDQLAQAGNRSGPTTLIYPPMTALNIFFSPATFVPHGETLSYYATMLDHTPLPAWLVFSASPVRFTGATPPISTSPESFDILLIASDIPGFAGIWVTFTIAVSNHQLFFSTFDSTVNVGANQSCNIQNLMGQLLLDGAPISGSQLASASANVPSWIAFDSQTLTITGPSPSSSQPHDVNVTVTAADEYGDVANTTLHILFAPDLPNGAASASGPNIWLSSSPTSSASAEGGAKSPGTLKTDGSASAPTSDSSGNIAAALPTPASKKNDIIAGVTIAVTTVILFLGLTIWYWRSPRQRVKRTASALKRSISRPYIDPDDELWRADLEVANSTHIEKSSAELHRKLEHPPQITLDFSPTKSSKRLSSQNLLPSSPEKAKGNRVPKADSLLNDNDSTNCSSSGRRRTDRPHNSMKLANQLTRSSSVAQRHVQKYHHCSFLSQRNSFRRSTGIPVSRRLAGLGHGRTSPRPIRDSIIFSPAQPRAVSFATEILDAASESTPSTSILSSFPPPPPPARSNCVRLSCDSTPKSSHRLSTTSPTHRDNTAVFRPVPRRQVHRSTFFAAGRRERIPPSSNRRCSSSRTHSTNNTVLATIYGSPEIPATCTNKPSTGPTLIVKPGDGSSPPPQATISPSGIDRLLNRKAPAAAADSLTPLARAHTQYSARSADTWQTASTTTPSASGSDVSQRRRVPGATHERLADVHSRFSARLRDRIDEGFWHGLGVGLGSGVRVPRSGRSSVLFADAEEDAEDVAEDVVCGAEIGELRMRGGRSESLYSASSLGLTGASMFKAQRRGGKVDLSAMPIMERPRASYRLGGDWDHSGGSRVSRLRLVSGKGKRPVSVEGREWVGSLKGSINSEKPVKGNEAFL